MHIWQKLTKPFLVLAPMDDVTDTVFRQVVAKAAPPDVFFTEFVSADGLQSAGRLALQQKLQHSSKEHPLIAQLWGKDPANYYRSAITLATMGFAGIDINMGCPVKKIIKQGTCAALINHPEKARAIIEATKAGAGNLPVSVKTRLGYNTISEEWLKFLLQQDLAALTIHGRTVKELSQVPAHWEEIAKVVKLRDQLAPQTIIIGNGDVSSRAQAEQLVDRYGVDGVMIGRGVFNDPWVFSSAAVSHSPAQYLQLYQYHLQLFTKTWGKRKNPQSLKRFAKVYISGFANATDLRTQIMNTRSVAEITALIETYLQKQLT